MRPLPPALLVAAPALGSLMNNIMYASSLTAVWAAETRNGLRDLNPLPYPLQISNCILWFIYGLCKKDNWIVWGAGPGVVLGVYMLLRSATLIRNEDDGERVLRQRLLNTTLGLSIGLLLLAYVGLMYLTPMRFLSWVGIAASANAAGFFVAPILNVRTIIRTKSAVTLHPPLVIASFLNNTMWFVYGFALSDPFLIYPSLFGSNATLFQLVLCVMYHPNFGQHMQFSFAPKTDAVAKFEEMATLLGDEEEDGEGGDQGSFIGRETRREGEDPGRPPKGIQVSIEAAASGAAPEGGDRRGKMANGHNHAHDNPPAPLLYR